MSSKSVEHVDNALAKIRPLFEKARLRIEALKPGEKIPATKLAEELANEIGMKGASLYPTLRFLFDGYPGVKISRGAHGGILRLPLDVQSSVIDVSSDTTDSESASDNA